MALVQHTPRNIIPPRTGGYTKADRRARAGKAEKACDIVTKRLKCIGRELTEHPIDDDPLAPETRTRVRQALRNHQIRCEEVVDSSFL